MRRCWIALAATLSLCAPAWSETLCPQHFLAGQEPTVAASAGRTYALCYTGYADLYSAETRTPLWSAEHLTAKGVADAKGETRTNPFHADPNIPVADRSEESDYAASGFDRGHMSPFGDMVGPQAEFESFSLGNMVPQSPLNNRGVWAEIEKAVRGLAAADGELFVVTGPIFTLDAPKLHGRVSVPSRLFKAVYDPAKHAGAAYVAANAPEAAVRVVSLADLKTETGIDALPGVTDAELLALPIIR